MVDIINTGKDLVGSALGNTSSVKPIIKPEDEAKWNKLILGKHMLPGTILQFDCSTRVDYTKEKEDGKNSATVTYKGLQPRTIAVSIMLLDFEEMEQFNKEIKAIIGTLTTQEFPAYDIVHPHANMWGISQVYITEMSSPQPSAGSGYIVSFSLLEYRKPVVAPVQSGKVERSKKTDNPGVPLNNNDLTVVANNPPAGAL
jgi:hypothetical protein